MKNFLKVGIVMMLVVTLTACNCFKQMAKLQDAVSYTVTPEVLELNNGKVDAAITISFPVEYFNPKAVVKVTPVYVYKGGEVASAPAYVQGEKVMENYAVINEESGGQYTINASFDYTPEMRLGKLQLRAEVKCDDGEFEYVNLNNGASATKSEVAVIEGSDEQAKSALLNSFGIDVAVGINTLQEDLKFGEVMDELPSDYKRITTVVDKTNLLYTISSSQVTTKSQKGADLEAFKANVDNNLTNDRATQSIAVKGYASPDGPIKFNDKLSKARSESSKKVVAKLLKDSGLEIDAAAYGEDWEGFKELVEASNIKDKNLILQVLSLYNSPAERESEIKNLSAVFGELEEDVLPELRRSQIVNSTDIEGKSDVEIVTAFTEGDALTVEEYLYAAQELTNDAEGQVVVLKAAAKHYKDARVYNNLGVAQTKTGDVEGAARSFAKAADLNSANAIVKNTLLGNLANGDVDEAKKYSSSADAEAVAALAAAQGDYKAASAELSGYNKAIALFMSGDYSAAKRAISSDDSADADYLRAVIAAKQGNGSEAKSQLASATSKDAELKKKAATDVNLVSIL